MGTSLDERARKRVKDQLKAAQQRAAKLREEKFGKERLRREEAAAKAYDDRRKQTLKLKEARLEEAQARAEKRREQMFGEQRLKEDQVKADAYAQRRRETVRLKSARLEDAAAKSEAIQREQFNWQQEQDEDEEDRQARRTSFDSAASKQQEPKEKGTLKGRVVGSATPSEYPFNPNFRTSMENLFDLIRSNTAGAIAGYAGSPIVWTPEEIEEIVGYWYAEIDALKAFVETGISDFKPFKRSNWGD